MIVLFHKSGTTSDPTNFRPIALSNCDCKRFFSLLSKSFTSYMIHNEYFDKQTQKGFFQVSLAVLSTPAFHKKLYAMPGGIAARYALLGLTFEMLLGVFGTCLCNIACVGITFRLMFVN